jgi:hypothetical protein
MRATQQNSEREAKDGFLPGRVWRVKFRTFLAGPATFASNSLPPVTQQSSLPLLATRPARGSFPVGRVLFSEGE